MSYGNWQIVYRQVKITGFELPILVYLNISFLFSVLCTAVGADGFRLYLAETGDPDVLSLYIGSDVGEPRLEKVKCGLTVPTYVARTREAIRLSRGDVDARFPDGLSKKVFFTFSLSVVLLTPIFYFIFIIRET